MAHLYPVEVSPRQSVIENGRARPGVDVTVLPSYVTPHNLLTSHESYSTILAADDVPTAVNGLDVHS